MPSADVSQLLAQFAADAGRVLPLTALWAHGSLAYGDFVPGRSDLDLVALVGAPVTLRDGRLVTKREALDELTCAGADHGPASSATAAGRA